MNMFFLFLFKLLMVFVSLVNHHETISCWKMFKFCVMPNSRNFQHAEMLHAMNGSNPGGIESVFDYVFEISSPWCFRILKMSMIMIELGTFVSFRVAKSTLTV